MPVHYATYSRALKFALRSTDLLLALGAPARPIAASQQTLPVERILVCDQGHLGDAVLATAVLPALLQHYPQAEIGFLVHPGSKKVLEGHPQVRWLHTVEHWHLNRAGTNPWQRWKQHRRSNREALAAIRAVGYQIAIDLHPYFPNSIPLLRRCGITRRVGWSSAGFGRWLDDAVDDDGKPINMLQRHARILQRLGIVVDATTLRPQLHVSDAARQKWQARAAQMALGEGFIALHIGAHATHRRWPAESWAAVAAELVRLGHRPVVFGQGSAECRLAQEIEQACPAVVNLCDRLEWQELVAAIAACRLLVSHDSAAIHLAAAFDKPRICIATGIHDLRVWLQASQRSIVLSKPVACAPCGRIAGCATMECIRGVSREAVVDAALSLARPSAATNARRCESEASR